MLILHLHRLRRAFVLFFLLTLPLCSQPSDTVSLPPPDTPVAPLADTRAPIVRAGGYFRWFIMVVTLGARIDVEPVRDVIGLWGHAGWAPYPVVPVEHVIPSELDLAAGLRVHPLPFGDYERFYVDVARKWYWDLELWGFGVGACMVEDCRRSHVVVNVGLSYEWGPDTRPVAEPQEYWRIGWLDIGVSWGIEPFAE